MRLKICLVAEGVIRDAQTNGISIYNVLEAIIPEGFPVFIQKVVFFGLWERDNKKDTPNQCPAKLSIKLDDEVLFLKDAEINFQGKLRTRTITTVNGLVVSRPGKVTFMLEPKDGPIATYDLIVKPPEDIPQIADVSAGAESSSE